MDEQTKNLILEKQISKVGKKGDDFYKLMIGDFLGSLLKAEDSVRWAASMLGTVDYTESIVCSKPADKMLESAIEILAGMGKILDPAVDCSEPILTALVGSGFMNLNPTIVCMVFSTIDENSTSICITASAKEGLIKQRSSKKAVKRMISML